MDMAKKKKKSVEQWGLKGRQGRGWGDVEILSEMYQVSVKQNEYIYRSAAVQYCNDRHDYCTILC